MVVEWLCEIWTGVPVECSNRILLLEYLLYKIAKQGVLGTWFKQVFDGHGKLVIRGKSSSLVDYPYTLGFCLRFQVGWGIFV